MSFSELLKQCRKQKGISQAELASKLGVTQQAVGKWESGKSSPDPATVARIAEILSTTADFLLGLYRPVSNVTTPEERCFGNYAESLIPVIGTVKAGYGALAFEEDYGQEYARVKDPSNYFYLVVRGDSMEPRIQDGDLALVHKQDTLENGDLGVLVYGDEGEGTLKRYIQRGNCVVLQPFNPAYNELVIKGDDLNRLHIAGRVVETKAKWGASPLSPGISVGVRGSYPLREVEFYGTVADGQAHHSGRQCKIRRRLHVQRRVPCGEGRYSRQLLRAGLLPRIHRRRPLCQPAEGPDEQLLCF